MGKVLDFFCDCIDACDKQTIEDLELELIAAKVKYETYNRIDIKTERQLNFLIKAETQMKIIEKKLERLNKNKLW